MSRAAKARVLICDDERGIREMLRVLLKRRGYDVTVVAGVRAAAEAMAAEAPFDAVITDLRMPDGTGIEVLEAARRVEPSTQVVLMTAYATTERAVEAMRKGAYDYLEKPFQNDVLLATLDKAIEKRRIVDENRSLRSRLVGDHDGRGLIGVSDAMVRLRQTIDRAAGAKTSVLITGESGTGKELVARALHFGSRDGAGEAPFIVVNCGALPENLMESELFGHKRGAFTGADAAKEGLFRAADGGTLFLDEVGELPLSLQVKLLRVLQERKVRPVGESDEIPVDVRVLAATNRDLEADIEDGSFREDLYYRLNVIRLQIPPLRSRPEDIRPLAEHLLAKHCALQERRLTLSDATIRHLARQSFPGNVRELENLLERAVALAEGPEIEVEDLGMPATAPDGSVAPVALTPGFDLDAHLSTIEKRVLLDALEEAGGVKKHAAALVGMTFRSFRYRLAKYDLDDE